MIFSRLESVSKEVKTRVVRKRGRNLRTFDRLNCRFTNHTKQRTPLKIEGLQFVTYNFNINIGGVIGDFTVRILLTNFLNDQLSDMILYVSIKSV